MFGLTAVQQQHHCLESESTMTDRTIENSCFDSSFVGRNSREFWLLGFLVLVPYIGPYLTVLIAAFRFRHVRHDPEPMIRENARQAVNWNLTFFVILTPLASMSFLLAAASFVLRFDPLFAIGACGILLADLMVILHFGITIWGTIRAKKSVARVPFSIRFFR